MLVSKANPVTKVLSVLALRPAWRIIPKRLHWYADTGFAQLAKSHPEPLTMDQVIALLSFMPLLEELSLNARVIAFLDEPSKPILDMLSTYALISFTFDADSTAYDETPELEVSLVCRR